MTINFIISFIFVDTFKQCVWTACLILISLIAFNLLKDRDSIQGIFKIPGSLPILGHLLEIQLNPSLVFMRWWERYDKSIFQIKIGFRKVVIVNSYEDVTSLWLNHACQNNSRPLSYTFHSVVSSYQSYTIGTTPFSNTYKNKKKSLSQLLNKPSLKSLIPIINTESNYIIDQILKDINKNDSVNLRDYLRFFVLRCCIHMSYGLILDCFGKDRELCMRIINNENNIIRLRSPISNIQDSILILQLFPSFTNTKSAHECGKIRDRYMRFLYNRLIREIDKGNEECINSMVGKLVTSQCKAQLTDQEINSICLTLVSAGLDNTPLTLDYAIGILSQPRLGESIQSRAIKKVLIEYDQNDFKNLDGGNKMNTYITAILLESLREFTVLPLSLPRITTKQIIYNNILLPPNTTLFMNAYAANHDPVHFEQPYNFIPERWLNGDELVYKVKNFQHFAFGAGSRMCSGQNLAMRQMYIFLLKFLLMFKIKPPSSDNDLMEVNPFTSNSNPRATSFEPKNHKVHLKLRNILQFEDIMNIC
ncbi:hypothetical protein KGF54_001602 [Candida jiufengensis]|uniref:uncharacterized protein n=1 Tax=Candida jiufengensis TaxID=497108 RepID=UPI002224C263|nr:uncharacterized protein KGF54_001602 [Candida jiufengensis]KAI5955041.1 hypothetical protein KGF54_001602 [Candida jiufengensis]